MVFWVFLVHPNVVTVLLSGWVEKCFVSRMQDFFCPKRLGDFLFRRGWVIFFLSREVRWFFFVPRGLMNFLAQQVGWLFGPQRWGDFCCAKKLGDFILSREVGWFYFIPKGWVIVLSQEVGWFLFVSRGWVIFLSWEVEWFFWSQ